MKVIQSDEQATAEVHTEGAAGVTIKALLTRQDGAPGFTLREFTVEPGGHTPRHAHAHEHEVIIRAGSGTLWSEEREWALAPGVVVLVKPDEPHQFSAGPDGLVLYCIVPHAGHQ